MFLSLGSSMLQPPSENNSYFQHTSGHDATLRNFRKLQPITYIELFIICSGHKVGTLCTYLPQRRPWQGKFFFDVFNIPTLKLKTWSKIHDNVLIKTPTTRGNVRLWQLTTSEGACGTVETFIIPEEKAFVNLVYFWLHVQFLWKRHVGRAGPAEIRNSIQQSTRRLAMPTWHGPEKAFIINYFNRYRHLKKMYQFQENHQKC